MFILVIKPIQGGRPSLYFFDDYKELHELQWKHFKSGYSCHAYEVPKSIAGIALFEEVFGTVPYKITDAFEASSLALSEYLSGLEISDNLIKTVL